LAAKADAPFVTHCPRHLEISQQMKVMTSSILHEQMWINYQTCGAGFPALADSDHYIPEEQPEALAAVLREFFLRHPEPEAPL
jgi:hypothetical protein